MYAGLSPSGVGCQGEAVGAEGDDGVTRSALWPACDIGQEYGCYLDADAIAAATSCREMAEALHNILRLAEKCESYKVKER